MDAGEKKAADHRDEKCEDGSEKLGCGGVGIGMVQGHAADSDGKKNHGNEGVGEEKNRFAREVADGLVLRDVALVRHGVPSKDYSK